ncbi:para-aminobenzoate synthase, (PABA) [Microbotryomycetes sp. JL201]|nr:para-aminobenzoate synthase, (PABA) [Microbotryomycetes sp. JL201]
MDAPLAQLGSSPATTKKRKADSAQADRHQPTTMSDDGQSLKGMSNGAEAGLEDKGKAKKRRKEEQRALENPPSFSFDTRGFSKGRFVQVKDVRDLTLHLLSDEKAQQWLYVANKRNVRKVVVVMAPGITATTLGVEQPPLSANLPFSLAASASAQSASAASQLPVFQRLFSHACPTRAPGDRYKLHSAYQHFINCPLTGGEKERRERARKEQGQLAKTTDPAVYLLTREQMEDQAYPVPSRSPKDGDRESMIFDNWKRSDGWIEAPWQKPVDGPKTVLGLDCEMCLTEDGSELARLSIVDQKGQRIYDSLVKPEKPIVDYLTKFSGLTEEKLASVTKTLEDVQRDLIDIIDYNTILIGHSLECDLRVLKLVHSNIIDTSVIYQHPRGPPFKASLKWLAQKWLKREIQAGNSGTAAGGGHDSEEDARTCIDLLNLKMQKGPGFGEFTNDQETIFERIARGTDPKRSAVVDHGTPGQWHGAKASTAIGCTSDQEVLEGALSALDGHQLIIARFMELSNKLQWTGTVRATAEAASANPVVAPVVETDLLPSVEAAEIADASARNEGAKAAFEQLNSHVATLHAALPPLTALIVFTGNGDPRAMSRLAAKKAKFDRLWKTVKQSEIAQEDKWMEQDDQHVPTTLILEHHDSYTRNLLALFNEIVKLDGGSLWHANGWQDRVVIVNVDSISWTDFVSSILPNIDCIILGPGPGSPHKEQDFSWPTRLIQEFGDELPIFGLCLGHQGLATTFGASVRPAAAPRHGQMTKVCHSADELYGGVPNEFDSVQYNSLTVDPSSIPSDLEPIAWAENQGQQEVLALRHRTKPLWGVQYHLESVCSRFGARTLSNFLRLALRHLRTINKTAQRALPHYITRLSTSLESVVKSRQLPSPLWRVQSTVIGNLTGLVPEHVFRRFVKGKNRLGEIWLDSARASGKPQSSHLFQPTATWSYSAHSRTITIRDRDLKSTEMVLDQGHSFFTHLDRAQQRLKEKTTPHSDPTRTPPLGFVGFFGYEMREESMPLSRREQADPEPPQAEFALASAILTFDHESDSWSASALVKDDCFDETDAHDLAGFGLSQREWDAWTSELSSSFALLQAASNDEWVDNVNVGSPWLSRPRPSVCREQYIEAIEEAQSRIRSGDTYELCLTTQFRSKVSADVAQDPFDLYLGLRNGNPAPYSSYFRLPMSNLALLSSSPERFMHIDKEGWIEMKPIKGTVKRVRHDPQEDERRRKALEADEKERAENLMIVDLSRNDLLASCEVESVQVPNLMVVETYETVHQLVTSVVGKLKPGVGPVQAVEQAFPPGSMTGAPKLRSLRILHDLEGRQSRGVYSGAFGYVAFDGTTDLSVVIRTLILRGDELSLGAGGAITHLSDPAKEWEEVLVKVDAVVGGLRTEPAVSAPVMTREHSYSRLNAADSSSISRAAGHLPWTATLQHYVRSLGSFRLALATLLGGMSLWLVILYHSALRTRSGHVTVSNGRTNSTAAFDPYPDLPVFAWRNGTQFRHPLPPSWPDPWSSLNSDIVVRWLSGDRFPPAQGTLGVEAETEGMQELRNRIGLGTKRPAIPFQVPEDTVQRAFRVFALSRGDWRRKNLRKGEGFNDTTGRPLQIPRDKLFRGPTWWKMRSLDNAVMMPRVQLHVADDLSSAQKAQDSQRREWVRRAFLHVWENYKAHAWGHDELRPLSASATDKFSGWGATIFDALDTLLVMGLEEEYLLAREHVAGVDFTYLSPPDPTRYAYPSQDNLPVVGEGQGTLVGMPAPLASPPGIPTFETVIRYLGSMISAYDLSGDPLMLERAIELGDWLLPSMSTRSGLLVPTYRLGLHPDGAVTGQVCIAEVGSVSMEFTRLSQITGDPIYFETISRAMDTLDNFKAQERVPHLFPTQINPEEQRFLPGVYTMGGQADSYYEYLLKMHQLLDGQAEQYSRMYKAAMDSARQVLLHPITVVPGLDDAVTFSDLHFNENRGGKLVTGLVPKLDHLTAFAAGMLALGARLLDRAHDLVTAKQFMNACVWAYDSTRTGLGAEILHLWSPHDPDRWTKVKMEDGSEAKAIKGDPTGVRSGEFRSIQRPETIESLFYLYRITGDRGYQDKGWTMFTNWIKATIVEHGLANVDEINSDKPVHEDTGIESFVFSETFKYYYLLFSPLDLLSLDDWVFTTEAHPFRLRSRGRQQAGEGPFWSGSIRFEMPRHPLGQGTATQQWARVMQAAAAVRRAD